jgi:Flp pilus assembly protein TadG
MGLGGGFRVFERKASRISKMAGNNGQAVLEMVLVLPLLLLLIVGSLELGRLFFLKITVTNAAREGAYYLSMHCTTDLDPFTNTIQAAKDEANSSTITVTINSEVLNGSNKPVCTVGKWISVKVTGTAQNIHMITLMQNGFRIKGENWTFPITSTAKMVALR